MADHLVEKARRLSAEIDWLMGEPGRHSNTWERDLGKVLGEVRTLLDAVVRTGGEKAEEAGEA